LFLCGTQVTTFNGNLLVDEHGEMVDSLLLALETNPTSSIQLLKTQTIPSFPMFTCTNCKCDVCRWIIQLGYFAPVETTIFRHILNNDTWENGAMVVDVGANVGYFSAYAITMGCRVASFEPNPHPRQFLLATSSVHDLHHTKWQVYPVAIGKEVRLIFFFYFGI
jgi:hypothetical protein